ncbi:HutD family protein [Kribbella sp. NPDC051620]|uniref:HutD family protein n=1 Tax=Kribbella sp. NPDC051620 TaxID=3364120 RepID=UPI0037A9CCD8
MVTPEVGAARILTPDAVNPVPWRNGAGSTRQLVDDPAGWRLSVADLEQDADFSYFPGLDRTFLPLVDVLLLIDGERRPVARGTATEFPGEATVAMELVAGPGQAVNLMTIRGSSSGALTAISRPEWEQRDRDQPGLFVDLGELLVEVRVQVCGD